MVWFASVLAFFLDVLPLGSALRFFLRSALAAALRAFSVMDDCNSCKSLAIKLEYSEALDKRNSSWFACWFVVRVGESRNCEGVCGLVKRMNEHTGAAKQ